MKRHFNNCFKVLAVLVIGSSLYSYLILTTRSCSLCNYVNEWSLASISALRNVSVSSADDACQFGNLTMLDEPRPVTALASFAGSGNTWVRYLLQRATGIGTSSIHCDTSLLDNGFPFDGHTDRERLLVTKTHRGYSTVCDIKAAILIIRNPFDALLAFFNFMMTEKNHTGIASDSIFRTEWHKFAIERMKLWEFIYMFYAAEFEGPVLLVVYEVLKENVMQELTRMLTFLNQTVQQDRMACIQRDIDGQHRRPNVTGLIPKDLYPANLTKYINDIIIRVAPFVKAQYGVDISVYKR